MRTPSLMMRWRTSFFSAAEARDLLLRPSKRADLLLRQLLDAVELQLALLLVRDRSADASSSRTDAVTASSTSSP